jgi:hypothetical protein
VGESLKWWRVKEIEIEMERNYSLVRSELITPVVPSMTVGVR